MDLIERSEASVYGAGIVDIKIKSNDPIYIMWKYMIRQCYRYRGSKKAPSMCAEWLRISNFYPFVISHGGRSKSLKFGENKFYSPSECYFVEKKPAKEGKEKNKKRTGCTCSCTCGSAKLIAL